MSHQKNFARLTIAALGAIFIATATAIPAQAEASLPSTDQMYVIGCGKDALGASYYNDGTTPLNTIQLFSVDPATAEATAIGSGTGSNVTSGPYSYSCDGEPAWNPATNTAYFKAVISDGSDSYDALMTMDLTTGIATEVAEITGFESAPSPCSTSYQSMAIADDGSAYAFDANSCFYSLDLTTAVMTYIGGEENPGAGRYYAQAWSLNPATGIWQVLEMYDEFLSSVDAADGILSPSGPAITFEEGYDPQSMEFDSNGQGWAINENFVFSSMTSTSYLYTVDPASGAVSKVGSTRTASDGDFLTTSLLITRPAASPTPLTPTLPNTGLDRADVSTIAWTSAAALVGGLLVLAYRRRISSK